MLDTLIGFMRTPEGSGILIGVLTVWPLWRTFLRAGLNPYWSLLVFLPLIGIAAALAALCLQRWPVVRAGGVAHPQGASPTIREHLRSADSPAPPIPSPAAQVRQPKSGSPSKDRSQSRHG